MTKRDYELIARAINLLPEEIRNATAKHFVPLLKEENSRFNPKMFMDAIKH